MLRLVYHQLLPALTAHRLLGRLLRSLSRRRSLPYTCLAGLDQIIERAAKAGDRITYKGLARAALEDGTRYYRARRTRSTLTVVDRTSAPCQLRGQVAGVSPTRSCFWLQGGQHVLAGRFALPLMGQVIELYGGEVTNAGNYFAGATASMRADGQELVPVHMEKILRGADSA